MKHEETEFLSNYFKAKEANRVSSYFLLDAYKEEEVKLQRQSTAFSDTNNLGNHNSSFTAD